MALDNFVLQNTNPLEAYFQGAGGVQTLQNNQQVMDLRRQQMEQAQQAQVQAQQQAEAAQAAAQLKAQQAQALMTGKYSPSAVAAYVSQNPSDWQAVKVGYDAMRTEQRADAFGFVNKIESAYMANAPEVVQKLLDDRLVSLETSGAPQEEIEAMRTFGKLNKVNPRLLVTQLAGAAAAADPDKYFESRKAMIDADKTKADTAAVIGKEGREAEMQPLEVEAKKATTEKIREETRSELQKRGLTSAQIAKTQVEAEKQLQELGQEGGGKPPTEGQAKANLFGTRAKDAAVRLNMLELDPANIPHVPNSLVRVANFTPTALGGLTEKEQSYLQYKRDFINSVLRRESGAAIGQDEFDSAELQYFPQLGEGNNIVRQKAASRKQAADLILAEAGSFAGKGATPSGAKTATKASIIAAAKAHGVNPLEAMKQWTEQGNILK